MGPWSLLAAEWLPVPTVFGQQSPSLVYDTGKDVPAEALFLDYQEDGGNAVTVEVFPRADGSTHVTAFSGQAPLPIDPADVKPDPDAIARLQAICERLSPAFRAERIIARQACFRPVTQDGLPADRKGARAARVPISPPGIASGAFSTRPPPERRIAELIADGSAATTDLAAFDPARLRPLDPASIRIA